MDETQFRFVPATRNPAVHPAAMAVDPIPHHFTYEPANPPETINAVKLCHAERCIVTMPLRDQSSVFVDVGLTAAGSDARFGCHLIDKDFEVTLRQTQIEVQLAQILIFIGVDSVVSSIKCLDDAWSDGPSPAIAPGHDLDPVVLRTVFSKNVWGVIG